MDALRGAAVTWLPLPLRLPPRYFLKEQENSNGYRGQPRHLDFWGTGNKPTEPSKVVNCEDRYIRSLE